MSASDDEIAAIVERLDLAPHPEGGYFAETYRSERNAGERAFSTAIYFLVTAASPSRMHRVAADEMWHFYRGDPLEMLALGPSGRSHVASIGSDLAAGQSPQVLVPAGTWQGTRVAPGGRYALVGATVTPGFDFADFEMGDAETLIAAYPAHADLIRALS
jgi:predicted cupin superfamily sugar epimerase